MVKRIDYNFNELTLYYEYEGIPKTNNNIELYFKTTLPRYLKRRYRTHQRTKKKTTNCKNTMDSQSSTKEKYIYDKFLQHEHKRHKTTQQKTTYPPP